MDRYDLRSELDHFRPAGGGLQPGAMMERIVPVANWCVVTPGGQFQQIRKLVFDDQPFDFGRILSVPRGHAEFAEHAEGMTQRGGQMSDSLTDGEAVGVAAIAGDVTDVAKAHEVEFGLRQVCTSGIHAVLCQCRLQGQGTKQKAEYLSGASKFSHVFLEVGRSR